MAQFGSSVGCVAMGIVADGTSSPPSSAGDASDDSPEASLNPSCLFGVTLKASGRRSLRERIEG
jgi:hypothetical protein